MTSGFTTFLINKDIGRQGNVKDYAVRAYIFVHKYMSPANIDKNFWH